MKITGFRHRAVSVPVTIPVVSSVRHSKEIVFVLLDVMTDEGLNGIAYAQAFNPQGANAVRSMLQLLEKVIVGKHPAHREPIWHQMWDSIKLFGQQGLAAFACSMVDIALWDIAAKSAQIPVYRMLGGTPDPIEAYASDGCWLVSPLEAARQAEAFVESGFSALKMRLGRKSGEEDVRALSEIRRAVGDHIEVMGDVNQGWTVDHAVDMAQKLEPCRLKWLEEPIEAEDLKGYERLKQSVNIPVAAGENLYAIRSTRRFLELDALSVYTPDLQRIGGVSGWLRLYALFELNNARYSIHLFPEFAVHLLAAAKKPDKLEWMSWAGVLFREPLKCANGKTAPPERPGFGMEWDEKAITKYAI